MDTLDRIFRASFKDALSLKKIGTKLVARQLAKQGITLNQEQLEKIAARFENIGDDPLTISLDDLALKDANNDNLLIQIGNLNDVVS